VYNIKTNTEPENDTFKRNSGLLLAPFSRYQYLFCVSVSDLEQSFNSVTIVTDNIAS